jgi:hypothetical protein
MKQALYISLLAASLGGFVMPVIAADSTATPIQKYRAATESGLSHQW